MMNMRITDNPTRFKSLDRKISRKLDNKM
jgi:hypothetical protein